MSLLHAEYLKVSRRKLFPIMIVLLASLMGFIALLFTCFFLRYLML